jgi:hypothetical protein
MADAGSAIEQTIDVLSDYYRLVASANPPRRMSRSHQPAPGWYRQNSWQLLRHHLRQWEGHVHRLRLPQRRILGAIRQGHAVNDRCRFVEHSLGALKSRFGVKSIDVAMPPTPTTITTADFRTFNESTAHRSGAMKT